MLSAAAAVTVLACSCSLLLLLVHRRRNSERGRELYDDADALLLNLAPPTTRWFNMGYWTRDSAGDSKEAVPDFPAAAAELCRRVAGAARLEPGERVCEVGYGFGDSTLLLAREYSPRSYYGLTSLSGQHQLAARRAKEAELDATRFTLEHGDAARDLARLPSGSQDVVLAVDCAYHFDTRAAFLAEAHRVLAPGGRVALTDLLLPGPATRAASSDDNPSLSLLDRLALRLLFLLAHTPSKNFLPPSAYKVHLVSAGFDPTSVELTDLSEHVWPGFCKFMRERDGVLGQGTAVLGSAWRGLMRYTRVVAWYSGQSGGRRKLHFYLVAATKAKA